MSQYKKLKWLVKKDLIVLWRHKELLAARIFFPILMITLFGYGMGGDIENIPIAVDAPDNGELTNQTLMDIKSDNLYDVKYITNNSEEAKKLVDNRTVMSAILLPSNFDDNGTNQKTVTLYADSSEYMSAQFLIPATEISFSKKAGEIGLSKLSAKTMSNNSSGNILTTMMQGLKLEVYRVYGTVNYMDFLVPAVLGLVIMMSCVLGMGEAIAGEREKGELTRLFMTPTSISTVITGKIASKLIIETLMVFILLFTAYLLFDIKIFGGIIGWINVVVLLILGVLCFVGLGIMLSARVNSQEGYIRMAMPVSVPMMFICGVFYPIETMPWIFQKIAYLLPLTYLNDAMRSVMLRGASLTDIWFEIAILLLFTAIFFIIGVKTFNRDI